MATMTNLSDVRVENPTESVSSEHIMNYFKLILKILFVFILFCWTSTSNYLNSLNINTDTMYPVFGKTQVTPNPYATMFNPGPVDMSKEEEIKKHVGFSWWFEQTQQSSYQFGGLILHYVFNFLKWQVQGIEETKSESKSSLLQFFSFLQWFVFAILSNLLFASFFGLVFLMWIPGVLGGLIAFMPLAYNMRSFILQLCYKGFLLFWTFIWMCIFGWVTFFPIIYEFLHLLYLVWFKQFRGDKNGFVDEFMKRMKQLIYIYIAVAVIAAFADKHLPQDTKKTVAVVCVVSLLYAAYNRYQSHKSV
jgi:hypothetical protein